MKIIYIISLLAAVLSNSVLIIILAKRKEQNISNILFILFLFLINFWGIPQIIVNYFNLTGDTFVAIDKISDLGYTFISVVFLLFALSFINKLCILRNYLFAILLFLPAIIFLYLAWNTNLIEIHDFHLTVNQYWGYKVPIGSLFPYFTIWLETIFISAMLMIIRFYATTSDIMKKKQALWLIIAILIPLITGTITNAILPALKIPFIPLAIPATTIMALIIVYAVLRTELFDLSPLTILSSLGNGVISVNKFGKIVQINNSAAELLGLKDDVIGKDFKEIVNLQNCKDNQTNLKSINPLIYVLKKGKSFESSNYWMISNTKKKLPVDFTITPLIEDHNMIGATLVFRDIVREKDLERNKNEFISIASHELKTPITAIKAFSQILEKRLKPGNDKINANCVANINSQVDRITLLINDLLNVSRIEAGKLVLNKKKFAINDLIIKVVNDFQYYSNNHKIIRKGNTDKQVFADEERINEVLINLITNAIKYSPREKKIIVGVSEKMNELLISVQDYGIGIPKKDQKKIFERFYRTTISEENKIIGFGLGLYISSVIIKRHLGKIWVECPKPKGSIFRFTLPVEK